MAGREDSFQPIARQIEDPHRPVPAVADVGARDYAASVRCHRQRRYAAELLPERVFEVTSPEVPDADRAILPARDCALAVRRDRHGQDGLHVPLKRQLQAAGAISQTRTSELSYAATIRLLSGVIASANTRPRTPRNSRSRPPPARSWTWSS